jgi:hypothetical protein
MQYAIETTFPLIAVCVIGLVLIIWAVVVGLSRMRLWNAQRRESELRSSKLVRVANQNIDAVAQVIGEMAARPAMYETMSSDVSESLYAARRAAGEL